MTAVAQALKQETASGFANLVKRKDGVSVEDIRNIVPLTRDFPAWHFAMLNDADRNTAIENTISRLDLTGKIVFEIGTGCGLIALLFAKYGAEHVFTCEINAKMADIAQSVIAETDFQSRITLYRTDSTSVIERNLLPRAPDIIFTETLDCGVVGEGFHHVARDISALATEHTQIIPATIRQFGILIEAPAIIKLNRVEQACGFNISALNAYSTRSYFPVREKLYDYTPLSDPFLMHEYSYLSTRATVPCTARAYRSGSADGVLSWFEAQFGDETVTNSPGTHGHWHQAFHPFDRRVELSASQDVQLKINELGQISAFRA